MNQDKTQFPLFSHLFWQTWTTLKKPNIFDIISPLKKTLRHRSLCALSFWIWMSLLSNPVYRIKKKLL
uniref:Uncharacterized protein n=1 Tax=Anguilla anguilla TaxID=7936 RepID=A0A0E9X4D0_ANGAN